MFVYYKGYIRYRQGSSYTVLEFFNQRVILVWKVTGVYSRRVTCQSVSDEVVTSYGMKLLIQSQRLFKRQISSCVKNSGCCEAFQTKNIR
jgi:hypothetical protein